MTVEHVMQAVSAFGGILVPIALLLLRNIRTEAAKRSDGIETQVVSLRREIEQRMATMETRFDVRLRDVERDKLDMREWIRVSTSTREKMDQMITGLARLDARIDAEFGVAASLDRLVEKMPGPKGDGQE